MEKNFWRMKDLSLFSVPYAYVDHESYLADSLFIQKKISIKFKKELGKDASPYRIIFCRVSKKDIQKFEKAMDELKNKMLLLEHADYTKFCSEVAEIMGGADPAKE